MLQHKTTTPGGCQQAAAFVLPLTDKQGRGAPVFYKNLTNCDNAENKGN